MTGPDLVLCGGRLITPRGTVPGGWVAVRDGLVTALGTGAPPAAEATIDVEGDWLAPGFVDVHVHGGGGGDFMSQDRANRRKVRELHLRHGTTAMLASTVSAPEDQLVAAVARLAQDAEHQTHDDPGPLSARLLGVHLEGPFISWRRRGAHDEHNLLDPDPRLLDRLLEQGRGWVRTLTLAPELTGALDLVDTAVAAGVVVCLGHTDADAEGIRTAVDAGASALTHTFNCMTPLHHRHPGGVGMAMDLEQLTCELILDLVHVHPVAARVLVRSAGAHRVCLITDAMSAAGMPEGRYELGTSTVDVTNGRALLSGTDTLAGSTLTMATAVRNAVAALGLDVPTAVSMATTVPARLLRRDDVGQLLVGKPADLVRLDDGGGLQAVWRAGCSVPDSSHQRLRQQ
jgi:N-acetylglucosamine-6-phosphate deacetylase